MAKYLHRSCPKCDGYLGIVIPERKTKTARAGDEWTVFEMWLPACVGVGWEQNINATTDDIPKFVSSCHHEVNQI